MAESSQAKTEKPTPKRLREAREKGQVARSNDLVSAIALLAVTAVIVKTGASGLTRVQGRIADGLTRMGDNARASIAPTDLIGILSSDLLLLLMVVGPWLLAAAAIAVGGHLAQTGWIFAPERLKPDFTRLSPKNGLSRLKPSQSWVDLLKTILAATAVGVIAYHAVRSVLDTSPQFAWMPPDLAAAASGAALRNLLYQVGFALVAVGAGDYGLQWWRLNQQLSMSKQELREEMRSSDGNPEIKARVRKVQREMTRNRMLKAVKTATVVITNPTHYAVALEYHRGSMAAPKVVAKGQDFMAARIRELARDASVPIIENVSLARALYAGADVGDTIPADLFGAVAEVLAYLVRIKQLML
jgi:flagellar biosynthesis protein FlhB